MSRVICIIRTQISESVILVSHKLHKCNSLRTLRLCGEIIPTQRRGGRKDYSALQNDKQ